MVGMRERWICWRIIDMEIWSEETLQIYETAAMHEGCQRTKIIIEMHISKIIDKETENVGKCAECAGFCEACW
jgi:hypothetical protein